MPAPRSGSETALLHCEDPRASSQSGRTRPLVHRLEPDGRLERIDGALFGPTVVWGTVVAVHDWSSDSIWFSEPEGGRERLPLWVDAGFHADFRRMVPGTAVPTVVAVDVNGGQALWRASP